MKNILVPTDFSTTATIALGFAIEMAKKANANVHVLHVIELPTHYLYNYPFQGDVIDVMKQQANEAFESWNMAHANENRGLKIKFYCEQSEVIVTINRYAEEYEADLIVMGTHGISGLLEYFVGSTTEKMIRFAKVPVLAVKAATKIEAIKNIVFPTTLGLNETALVREIKALQQFFKAHLHVIYINTQLNFKNSTEIRAQMDDYVKHYDLQNCSLAVVDAKSEQIGIMEYAKKVSGPIITMATHSRRGLSHFFTGSITEEVVTHVDCPIWTYSLRG